MSLGVAYGPDLIDDLVQGAAKIGRQVLRDATGWPPNDSAIKLHVSPTPPAGRMMDLTQLNQDFADFTSHLAAWATAALPNIFSAILILVIGWWLSAVAARAISRLVEAQPYVDATLQGVLKRIVRWGLLLIVFVAALSQLGVATTSMLAALGAIGLAVGLALQGTLANIASGIMLLWLRPFRVGDYIEAGSAAGTVNDVGLFASHITTFEGVSLFVPNSELWGTKIVNYTRSSPRMVRFTFGIAYEDDIAKARNVLLKLVREDARVLGEPAPGVFVDALGDNAVALELRAWTEGPNWVQLRFDLIEAGKLALDAAAISIPFPQRDIHIKDGSIVASPADAPS
jgi:small conductance mechanosensitive channel